MSNSKDKRTKEQILRLLDRAIEQEERLSEKIKSLETELADCRKKVENPRHEITEEALSASKVSFRIDYYRTDKSGPLKGIIEHIPSREPKPFEGEGWEAIQNFISRYLSEESATIGKKKTAPENKARPEAVGASQRPAAEQPSSPPATEQRGSRLLEGLKAEFAAQSRMTSVKKDAIASDEGGSTGLLQRLKTQFSAQNRSAPAKKNVLPSEVQGNSRLLQGMKAEFATQNRAVAKPMPPMQTAKPSAPPLQRPQKPAQMEHFMSKSASAPTLQPKKTVVQPVLSKGNKVAEDMPARRSRLLERIREEHHKGTQ